MVNTTSVTNVDKKTAETPIIDKLILTTVIGDEIDIFNQLQVMNIFEDIYSPVLSGDITLYDNINLFYKLPICGQEKLTVRFYSWNYDPDKNLKVNYFHRTFDIIKVSNVKQLNDYSTMYTLHFASPELKKNESIKISRAFANATPSEVVTQIMTGDYEVDEPTGLEFPIEPLAEPVIRSPFLSDSEIDAQYQKVDDYDSVELFVEKTKFKEPWITVPYMKPFDIIKWMSSRALRLCAGRNTTSIDNESPNFLFFENKRGFQFTSLDTLLENKENVNSLFEMGSTAQNQSSYNERGVYSNKIQKLNIMDCYDTLGNIRSGLLASRLYSYDMITGELLEKDYNYLDDFKTMETTESPAEVYPFIKLENDENELTKQFLAKRMLVPFIPGRMIDNITSEQTERNCNPRANIGPEAYLQKRIAQLARWTNFRIVMEVPGNSVNKVGDVVKVDLKDLDYKNGNLTEFSEISSKYYSGYYLISAIRHTITKFTYTQSIEAGKDAFTALIGKKE